MNNIQLSKDMRYSINSIVEFSNFRTDLEQSVLFLDNEENFLSDLLRDKKGIIVSILPENIEFSENACYIVRFENLRKSIDEKIPNNLKEFYLEDSIEIELLDLELK